MTLFRPHLELACLALLAVACGETREVTVLERKQSAERELTRTNPPAPRSGRVATAGAAASNEAASRPTTNPLPQPTGLPVLPYRGCRNGGYCRQLSAPKTTGLDLLFVIDNSHSMSAEQAALREQFPRLIHILTTGEREDGSTFKPAHDLHLGVVSTDMGAVGLRNNAFPGCLEENHFYGGDDGVLQHRGDGTPACEANYPAFLEYSTGADPEKLARDFGCIANLGSAGCGFEQPLEAGLKALWPKVYVDAAGHASRPEDNPVLFLAVTTEGRFGHGDTATVSGGSLGFARSDPAETGVSLLAVIVVTDEDDCSARNADIFRSTNDPGDPLNKQPVNLRCFSNKESLFPLERYSLGLQQLRPNHPDSVVFGVIAGVPPDLVDAAALEAVDFDDDAQRNDYYAKISRDARMQERVVSIDNTPASSAIAASCSRTDARGERADAYPPRRLVEVAKSMGKHGRVQSICQDDFGPAVDGMIDMMAQDPHTFCVPNELVKRDGKVDCEVVVELPSTGMATDCGAPYLHAIPVAELRSVAGVRCVYAQVTAKGGEPGKGEGFFYDDEGRASASCAGGRRIAFTSGAEPPPDARVYLDCLEGALR